MILPEPIETPNLLLKTLMSSDVGDEYVSWLRDPAVNCFLESRFAQSVDHPDLLSFIKSVNDSADNLMLGIFLKQDGRHIGNIKLGPIILPHARAEIGFLIGDKTCWGKGYASETIAAVSHFGLTELGLMKITAGCYITNVGSSKALLKAGFELEATLPSHTVSDGCRVSSLLFGMTR